MELRESLGRLAWALGVVRGGTGLSESQGRRDTGHL